MARSGFQKLKLPVLQQILLERTDEEHPMTTQEVIAALEEHGITAERKSIYDDMEALRVFGLDVQSRKGSVPGWFVGERPFQLPELKLLVDAVQSSRFITRRKSDALIRKLESLAGIYAARQLQRQVYVERRIKSMNESVYYNIDKLHTAITENRMISFRYFEYNVQKEKAYHRGGGRYSVSPFGLAWNSENYYLAGWDHDLREMRHYRVDKMDEITVLSTRREKDAAAAPPDMAAYVQKHFGMFGGREGKINLRCSNTLVGVVLDRFGQDAILTPDGEFHFTVTVNVMVSPQFWGWLFGLGGDVTILSPQWAREEYKNRLAAVSGTYDP